MAPSSANQITAEPFTITKTYPISWYVLNSNFLQEATMVLPFRYPGQGDTAYNGMCELQVLDDTADKYSKLDDRQYHGSAYGMIAAKRGSLKPVGEWNEQEVTVKGSKIKVVLNGTTILDGDLREVKDFMGGRPHPGMNRYEGYFGFAGHGDPVAFKNIRIKALR
jgi:hypothetical protein